MTRDEWNQVLATEPATRTQVGAVLGEFGRLGVVDRGERLAISAELLRLDVLGSTADLVMGDAGRLIAMLRSMRDRAELPAVAAAVDERQADEHDEAGRAGMSLGDVLRQIVVMAYLAFTKTVYAGGTANIGRSTLSVPAREGLTKKLETP